MNLLTARDVMSEHLLTVREDMTLEELAEFLVDHEISGAPVADAKGHLAGVVSLSDLAGAAAEGSDLELDPSDRAYFVDAWDELDDDEPPSLRVAGDERTVRDIMNPAVYSVDEGEPIQRIAETMLDAHIHRLVVTRGSEPVGIVTTSDLLRLIAEL